jgi:hypothetical protein
MKRRKKQGDERRKEKRSIKNLEGKVMDFVLTFVN